jgi:hypothetical protein
MLTYVDKKGMYLNAHVVVRHQADLKGKQKIDQNRDTDIIQPLRGTDIRWPTMYPPTYAKFVKVWYFRNVN